MNYRTTFFQSLSTTPFFILFFWCVYQHGSGPYDKTHFLDSGGRQLSKLVGHVFGEPSDGAEMLGDAELEEVQRVSPNVRNAS